MASINPDLQNENCDAQGTWEFSVMTTETVEVSPDGQFHLLTLGLTDSRCHIRKDVLSGVANFTIEFRLNLDVIGTTENHALHMQAINDTTLLLVKWYNGKIYVNDGATDNEVGTDLAPAATWITWRFEVTGGTAATATVDVYKNDVLVGDNVDCSYAFGASNYAPIFQLRGYASTVTECHFDWIKIGTGLGEFLEAVVDEINFYLEV